jgi:hypothetical protein
MSGHPLRRARAAFAHLPARLAGLAAIAHHAHRADRTDRGQATAEYGLVILAAGGIALGVIAWASGTGSFTDMFEAVIDKLSESL